ncbi:MAG: hypothetical protein A2V70_03475 [Planctomycetes bacterium RBG_13_63_9]|nr:MAG: hypothetical protein A2V70_03475 [Planctomycetes bacterium RBG_13_63_9]
MRLSHCHMNVPPTFIALKPGGCASGSGAIDFMVAVGMGNPYFAAECQATRSCDNCCPIVDQRYSMTTPVAVPIPFDGTGQAPVIALSNATCIAVYTGTCKLDVKIMIGTCGE